MKSTDIFLSTSTSPNSLKVSLPYIKGILAKDRCGIELGHRVEEKKSQKKLVQWTFKLCNTT